MIQRIEELFNRGNLCSLDAQGSYPEKNSEEDYLQHLSVITCCSHEVIRNHLLEEGEGTAVLHCVCFGLFLFHNRFVILLHGNNRLAVNELSRTHNESQRHTYGYSKGSSE